jgi:ABC-type transporter Mla subunit MlaD
MLSVPDVAVNLTAGQVHMHHHGATTDQLRAISQQLEVILTNQTEHAAQLEAVAAQVTKTREETLARVAELQAALDAAGTLTPAVEAAMAALMATVQVSDDVVPDAPL